MIWLKIFVFSWNVWLLSYLLYYITVIIQAKCEVPVCHLLIKIPLILCLTLIFIEDVSLNYILILSRYEGTGRSLSLKLLQQLREQAAPLAASAAASATIQTSSMSSMELHHMLKIEFLNAECSTNLYSSISQIIEFISFILFILLNSTTATKKCSHFFNT